MQNSVVTFEPFIDNDSYGRLELWMAFSQTGLMKSRQYFYGYDLQRVSFVVWKEITNFQVATTNSIQLEGVLQLLKSQADHMMIPEQSIILFIFQEQMLIILLQ